MGLFNLTGIVYSGYDILEAKLNNEIVYSPSKKYVEYTLGAVDEHTGDYPNYVLPAINGSIYSDAVAEIHTSTNIYYFNVREYSRFSIYVPEIKMVKIWYPDNITSISFANTTWLNEIKYIYTDDSITVRY